VTCSLKAEKAQNDILTIDTNTVPDKRKWQRKSAIIDETIRQYLTPSTMTTLRALFDETDDIYLAPFMIDLCPTNDAFILKAMKNLKQKEPIGRNPDNWFER
jgi:hypothetical protein